MRPCYALPLLAAAASAVPPVSTAWRWSAKPQPGWPGPNNTTLPNTAALTRWAADVGPDSSRPEHPRPGLVRPDRRWLSLNGVCETAAPPPSGLWLC